MKTKETKRTKEQEPCEKCGHALDVYGLCPRCTAKPGEPCPECGRTLEDGGPKTAAYCPGCRTPFGKEPLPNSFAVSKSEYLDAVEKWLAADPEPTRAEIKTVKNDSLRRIHLFGYAPGAWAEVEERFDDELTKRKRDIEQIKRGQRNTAFVESEFDETATPSPELEAEILRILNRDFANLRARPTAAEFWQEYVINVRTMAGLSRAKRWSQRTMKDRKANIEKRLSAKLGMAVQVDDFRTAHRKSGRITPVDSSVIERTFADRPLPAKPKSTVHRD